MESTQSPGKGVARDAVPRGIGDAPSAGPRSLAGRTALVTGGASGIGRACAVALAGAGAGVCVVDRAAEAAKSVAEEIGGTAYVVDLSHPGAVDTLPDDADPSHPSAGAKTPSLRSAGEGR